jgi:hypothetical protein
MNKRPVYSRPYQGTDGMSLRDKVAAELFVHKRNGEVSIKHAEADARMSVDEANKLMEILQESDHLNRNQA